MKDIRGMAKAERAFHRQQEIRAKRAKERAEARQAASHEAPETVTGRDGKQHRPQ